MPTAKGKEKKSIRNSESICLTYTHGLVTIDFVSSIPIVIMRNSIPDHGSLDCDFSIPPEKIIRRPIHDNYIDLEESEEEEEEEENDDDDEDLKLEMGCPYCSDGFDALELCVHLEDQHPLETKSGVCPLCATNLGRNMISHLIIQHESTLKSLCKRKPRDDESFSIISLLRKKLQEEHLRSLQESSSVASSTDVETDAFLLSFIYNPSQSYEPEAAQLDPSAQSSSSKKLPKEETLESDIQADPFAFKHQTDPLALKHQEEKAQKCDFVQTILFSNIFADDL